MKTYRNHHTRNRTRRRRMKGGGYNLDRMLLNIGIIKPANIDNFAEALSKLKDLVREAQDREFIDAIPAFNKVGLNDSVNELVASYDDVKDLVGTPQFPPGKQLVPYPEKFNRIIAAVTKFEEVVNAVKNKSVLVPQLPAEPAPAALDVNLNRQVDEDPQQPSLKPVVSAIDPTAVKARKLTDVRNLTPISSKEEEEVVNTLNRPGDKSLCEINYPKVYRILASGKFNGSDISSLLNTNNTKEYKKLLAFFRAVGYDHQTKTIKGRSIAEIYRDCHPDIKKKRPEDAIRLTNIFQVLTALNNFTGIKEKIQLLPSNIYSDPATQLAQTAKPVKPGRKGPAQPIPDSVDNPVGQSPPTVESSNQTRRLPARSPMDVRPAPIFPQAQTTDTSIPQRSSLAPTVSPPVLQQQQTPLTSEEQRQFLQGSYSSLQERREDQSICEYRYPEIYNLLKSGKFNGSDIISLLSSNDPKLQEFFNAIRYDKNAKTIMGHSIADLYRACHPNKGILDNNLTGIFQILNALNSYTGDIEEVKELEDVCEPELARLRAELEKVKGENTAKISELSDGISKEREKLKQLEASKAQLQQKINDDTALIQRLRSRNLTFAKDINKLVENKAQLEAEKIRLQGEIQGLETDLANEQTTNDKDYDELTGKYKQKKKEVKELTQQNAEQLAKHEASVKRLAKSFHEVSLRLSFADRSRRELEGEYAGLKENLEAAEASLADLNSRFEFTNTLIDKSREEIREDLAGISEKLDESVTSVTTQIKSVEDMLGSVNRRIVNATRVFNSKLDYLNQQLTAAVDSQKTEILAAIERLKKQNEDDMARLRDELAKITAENTQLQKELSDQKGAKERATGQVIAMEKEIERIKLEHVAALEQARQVAEKTAKDVEAAKEVATKASDEALAAQTAATAAANAVKDSALADKSAALAAAAAADARFKQLTIQSTAATAKADRLNQEHADTLKHLKESLDAAMKRAVAAQANSVQLSALQAQLTQVNEELAKNNATTAELATTTQTCNTNLAIMTERATTCDKNLAVVREQLKAALAAHATQTSELQQEKASSKQQLDLLNSEKAKLQSNLDTNTQRLGELTKIITEGNAQLRLFQTRIDELNTQKVGVERQLAVQQATSVSEKERFDASLANITQQLNSVTQQKETLAGQITEKQKEIQTLHTLLDDLKGQFASTNRLIGEKSLEISGKIEGIKNQIDGGLTVINDGIASVSTLVTQATTNLNDTRRDFMEEFRQIKEQLQGANQAEQERLKAQIKSLTESNATQSANLNAAKAAAEAELNELRQQLARETAAKAQAEQDFNAAQETARVVAQQNAAALEASRQQAAAAFAQFTAAAERGLTEEKERFRVQAELDLETLRKNLVAEREAAVATANTERKAVIDAQITELNQKIDTLQRKPEVPLAPELIRRYPDGDVPENSIIKIYWNSNGTAGPWILRIEYSEGGLLQFTDFQEVRIENKNNPIEYRIKRSGDLSGTIYNVTEID